MNLVRAPLWGRAQESCGGEDPLLIARHAAAFVRGLQEGEDKDHLLAAATCKDFPVYVSVYARMMPPCLPQNRSVP